jgi:hypothetical protein
VEEHLHIFSPSLFPFPSDFPPEKCHVLLLRVMSLFPWRCYCFFTSPENYLLHIIPCKELLAPLLLVACRSASLANCLKVVNLKLMWAVCLLLCTASSQKVCGSHLAPPLKKIGTRLRTSKYLLKAAMPCQCWEVCASRAARANE